MPNFFFYFFLVEEYLSPSKFIEFFGLFCIPYMFLQAFHISLNVKKKKSNCSWNKKCKIYNLTLDKCKYISYINENLFILWKTHSHINQTVNFNNLNFKVSIWHKRGIIKCLASFSFAISEIMIQHDSLAMSSSNSNHVTVSMHEEFC